MLFLVDEQPAQFAPTHALASVSCPDSAGNVAEGLNAILQSRDLLMLRGA